jgi:RND family efflux transporter MFP subunit
VSPKRAIALAMIVGSACAVGLTGCKGSEGKERGARGAASAEGPREVTLEQVTETLVSETVEVSGTLAADQEVTLAAKVAGRLASISVDLASRVKTGDALAQIETTDYELRVQQAEAQVAQARAQLGLPPGGTDSALDPETTAIVREARAAASEAQTNLTRARTLASEGITSQMQLDAAETAAVRAEAALQTAIEEVRIREATMRQRMSELRIARQQLADTVLRSPLDGIVAMRVGSVGEYFSAGTAVLRVVRINPLRLKVSVPEREAQALREGQTVEVKLENDPSVYTGKLARLAPSLDQQSRTLAIEADIENPGTLRPGSFVRSKIVVGQRPRPTVSKSALLAFAGIEKVITVEQGKAVEKRVTTGKRVGDRVEIVSGVKLGDRVVTTPGSLQQGQAVRVRSGV